MISSSSPQDILMQTSRSSTMSNTRPRMVRQISPSPVAAFDDNAGQKTMQFPPSSSPQDMLQKVSNGQSSVSISAASSSSSLSSCAFDTNAAAPMSARSTGRKTNCAAVANRCRPSVDAYSSRVAGLSTASRSFHPYRSRARIATRTRRHSFSNNHDEEISIHEGLSELCGESSSSLPLSSCLSNKTKFPANNNSEAKRSIHFNEYVCIKTIPSLDAYTDTEISSMYCSAEEEKILIREKMAVVATLRASRTGTSSSMGSMMQTASPHHIFHDDEEYCTRGLENHLLSGECKRKKIAEALDVIYSVLTVQEDQYNNNYCDDVALAMASMTRSQAARTAALERAARDEAEIKIAARNDFLDQTLAAAAKKADKFVGARTGLVPNARRNSSSARSTCSARASCA